MPCVQRYKASGFISRTIATKRPAHGNVSSLFVQSRLSEYAFHHPTFRGFPSRTHARRSSRLRDFTGQIDVFWIFGRSIARISMLELSDSPFLASHFIPLSASFTYALPSAGISELSLFAMSGVSNRWHEQPQMHPWMFKFEFDRWVRVSDSPSVAVQNHFGCFAPASLQLESEVKRQ